MTKKILLLTIAGLFAQSALAVDFFDFSESLHASVACPADEMNIVLKTWNDSMIEEGNYISIEELKDGRYKAIGIPKSTGLIDPRGPKLFIPANCIVGLY